MLEREFFFSTNQPDQVRSQKIAMVRGCFGGLGAEPPAAKSQWGSGDKVLKFGNSVLF